MFSHTTIRKEESSSHFKPPPHYSLLITLFCTFGRNESNQKSISKLLVPTAHTSKNAHCLPSCLCRWKICALGTGCRLPLGTGTSGLILRTLLWLSNLPSPLGHPLHWGILADAHAPCYFFYFVSPLWPHLYLAQFPLSSLSPVTIPSQYHLLG